MREINSSFNDPIELGTRSSLILASIGKSFFLDDLVMLDFSLLYSEDFGGPENLHPAVPNYVAEVSHRREVLPNALEVFVKKGLINMEVSELGTKYAANGNTLSFISCLQSDYYRKAWKRLDWMKINYMAITKNPLTNLTKTNI